jgi:hypothetical protein
MAGLHRFSPSQCRPAPVHHLIFRRMGSLNIENAGVLESLDLRLDFLDIDV